jgi:hypothetical protein
MIITFFLDLPMDDLSLWLQTKIPRKNTSILSKILIDEYSLIFNFLIFQNVLPLPKALQKP